MLFARICVKGKLIRQLIRQLIRGSLKTRFLSVAKLRLANLEKAERQVAELSAGCARGKMTFADALANRCLTEAR